MFLGCYCVPTDELFPFHCPLYLSIMFSALQIHINFCQPPDTLRFLKLVNGVTLLQIP